MTNNIVSFPEEKGTVGWLLKNLSDNRDDIASIVTIIQKKNGDFTVSWSDQSVATMCFCAKSIDREVGILMNELAK